MNTELCKATTSDFRKNLYKLMNNSVFGKTMGNFRKSVKVKLARGYEENRFRNLITNPLLAKFNIFDCNLAALKTYSMYCI